MLAHARVNVHGQVHVYASKLPSHFREEPRFTNPALNRRDDLEIFYAAKLLTVPVVS